LREQGNERELLQLMEQDWQLFQAGPELGEGQSASMLEAILGKKPGNAPVARPEPGNRRPVWNYWKVAAAFLVILLASASYWAIPKLHRSVPATFSVAKGSQKQLQLPDGSVVVMNGGGQLVYRERFWTGRREVQLAGEGFFQVAPDGDHPFVITTRKASIQVVGTQFNVKESPHDSLVWVAVVEGKVAFKAKDHAGQGAVHLTKNQLGLLTRNGAVQVHHEEVANYLSWMDGRTLHFDNTSLPIVARQLERLYGVPIRLQDRRLEALRLTATARKDSLSQLLDKITLSLGITYRHTPEGILLMK
jgi:ferric-dicitrate binding protein FerR (iron transport regulator)